MSLAPWQGRGANAPFLMTITITVDGTPIPNDWQAQQTSDPMAEVDLFVLNDDLTKSYPTSSPPPEPDPVDPPDTKKRK